MNFKISLPSWAMGTGKEALVYVNESRLWNKQANKQQQQEQTKTTNNLQTVFQENIARSL